MGIFLIIGKIILVLMLGSIATILFITGIKIFFADKSSYKANRKVTGHPLNGVRGTVPTFRDGGRDHRVCAGLAYDLKNHRLIEQGTLSDESVESILR